jgi:hypothetical protein
MILGFDWLEKYNPMKLCWGDKWLAIPFGDITVVIHGISSELSSPVVVHTCQLTEEDLQLVVIVHMNCCLRFSNYWSGHQDVISST